MRRLYLLALGALVACRPAEGPADPEARMVDAGAPAGTAVPSGMIFVPAGTVHIGSAARPEEMPVFAASVAAFALDRHPVTVSRFAEFVAATGYVTEAERLGDAAVMDMSTGVWSLVAGASWQRPMGPAGPVAYGDHPVTQVSWTDAEAFCAHAGGRLPTEVEWEHAARGAVDRRDRYPWGDSLVSHDHGGPHYHANTWTGTFPMRNDVEDGFLTTSPVGQFGDNSLGLTDMGGNVWEWTASWFRPYSERETPFTPTSTSERVQRGGSFLCHTSYCHGYRVSARSHSTPETSLFHVGFRCARDVEQQEGGA